MILAHCILNQNAKLDRCAHCPGPISEVLGLLLAEGIGIVQMECPEMLYLGLDRQTERGASPSVAAEDTRIARRMQEPGARETIARIAGNTARQVADYLRAAISRSWLSKLGYVLASGAFKILAKKLDPRSSNGALFLGLNGLVVKSHGGTDGLGFASAIDVAVDVASADLVKKIVADMEGLSGFEAAAGRTRDQNNNEETEAALS